MDLSSLKPACGSTHHEKRIGRGQGSGKGGTSTRGHKGAKSRSGYHTKIGFEGDRCLCRDGYRNLALKISTGSLIKQLMSACFRNWQNATA